MSADDITVVLAPTVSTGGFFHVAGVLQAVEDLAGMLLGLVGGVGVVEVSLCEGAPWIGGS